LKATQALHERGIDGWVSLEVSPLPAYNTERTIQAAMRLHAHAGRPNLLIKIPGTAEGLPAVTECVAAGVPVNVTLLFSADHHRAAADSGKAPSRVPPHGTTWWGGSPSSAPH
jgi:transaldolase